jgi:hypothetical protein
VGGGSLPGFLLDSWVVALRGAQSAARTAARLRSSGEQAADPDDTAPVLTRVRDDTVLLDVRTLEERDLADLEAAVAFAVR